jgi:CRP-like cAMP-binding protein
MITIEKVAVLRAVTIFATIPDNVLAVIARITEEVSLAEGETFINEGDLGDCLYLIVEGQVRVHSQGNTIIVLGPGQTVGELSVLDPEPRAASAVTLGPARLFRIDKALFDDVLADQAEIAHGVIRALCRRVRDQGRETASRLHAEPDELPKPAINPAVVAIGELAGDI